MEEESPQRFEKSIYQITQSSTGENSKHYPSGPKNALAREKFPRNHNAHSFSLYEMKAYAPPKIFYKI